MRQLPERMLKKHCRILHLRLDFAYLFAKKHSLLRNTYSISFGLDF